jgi:uncharacterized 2Fe-2S/4Fe-4S cluster protein (DUF4445 family)
MKHFNITFKPEGREITIHAGATILEAAGQAGIILNTVCGGKGTCEKCRVILQPSERPVLACQYHIQSDLTLTIPTASRFFEQKILARGIDIKTDNSIYAEYLKTHPAEKIFGLAVDIGTTTLVVKLIDMENGFCLQTAAALNPQTRYGDDCISRIAYAKNEKKLAEMQKTIIDCINQLITELCEKNSSRPNDIYEICLVGNTTMNHIFLGLPITQLGQAPYEAFSLEARDLPPEQLHININPAGNIHTVANIAGFLGADITAVTLATGTDLAEEVTLIIDIGTNGELVFGTADHLYAASCAAGPAFEGGRITHGSRAAEGAIEAVVINDDEIDIDIIGGDAPRSICGSGLIDAVAVLLNLGIIDETGRFAATDKLPKRLPANILSRIIKQDNQPAFCIAEDADQKVILTQSDIRQLQLAKAAIQTGVKILQKKAAVKDSDIKQVLLAGAFGNYIRKESALRIGLLPNVPPERIHFVGNAACSGAQMILLSRQARIQAGELPRKIEYVEIAREKDFAALYADSMHF